MGHLACLLTFRHGAGQARILLVDDEQAVQTLLTYPLRKEGYEVVEAMDGQEALERFSEQRFDLVVLDIMLPKLDGIEVCRRVRTRSQVPIIMLTAKGDEADKVAGLEMGADDYITKPFSVREFRSRVKAALRRGNMGGPGAGRARADPGGPAGDRLRTPLDDAHRESGAAHICGVRDPRGARRVAGSGLHAGRRSSRASGATPPTVTPEPSTCTSGTCGRSSSRDPKNPEYLFTVRGVGYRFRDSDRD